MKKWIAAPAVAGVLLISGGAIVDAETSSAPAQTDTASDDDDGGNAGLWGLLGLLGLGGLAGLRRRDASHRVDTRNTGGATSSTRMP